MARRTGRAKPMTAKAGVTKTKRRYACGGGEAVLPMSQSISRMPYGDI